MQTETRFINFAQGLDLKADPKQVPLGSFLSMQNNVFDKGGLLQKRNGFGQLTSLPDANSTYLTTFNKNLTSISNTINAFLPSNNSWVQKGTIQPISLNSVTPIVRSNTAQTQVDSAIANGFVCTAYTDQKPSNLAQVVYKYVVTSQATGQNVISPTLIPAASGGTLSGAPRVFVLGNWFIILFTNVITATSHLQYIAVNIMNPSRVLAPADIASSYIPSTGLNYDGVVVSNGLYVAYNTTAGGQAIKVTGLASNLTTLGTFTLAAAIATQISICADTSINAPAIYVTYYNSGTSLLKAFAINQNLHQIMAATTVDSSVAVANIAPCAQNGQCDIYYGITNAYSYDSGVASNFIKRVSIPSATAVPTTPYVVLRSVGLASRSFIISGIEYLLAVYASPYQNTYFLVNGSTSTSASPVILAKLAYSNGGGYLTTGLPSVSLSGNQITIPYLFKDLITSVNKNTNVPSGTQVAGIYSQTGINLAQFTLGTNTFSTAEIGSNLNLSGGFLWGYDGYLPVEQNFFVWPDSVEVAGSGTAGSMTAQKYYYQVIYQWTDNQGNLHQSAPSIPVTVTLTSDTSVDVNIPTLRLTYKTANPVKIVIFRWSTAQQVYYQTTSITAPLLNDTTVDSITFNDGSSDATILGNSLLYTTGGVVEDVSAPATNIMTLWLSRLFLVDAEDPNLIWFSKQVIENTPVEMSDLLTLYVASTIGASGSTGPITALGAMDDELIIFKRDAMYYISGSGPDNTGANNQFTDPILITSVVGCTNPQSVVTTPNGLMFQSDKGIWLLERGLNTNYVGAKVQSLTQNANVVSAVLVPGTNQVRFTMDSGITLMYDYYYQQWSTFVGVPGISSCIYNNLHTFINKYGQVFQETPGEYLDGTNPVLLGFTTNWINLGGIQGYQRIQEFSIVGDYLSPHLLDIQIAYDFDSPIQQVIIDPINPTGVYGSDALYGQTGPYGGPGSLEQWRIFNQIQKCQTVQISVTEVYNPLLGVIAGGGFTLSGINCVLGLKSTHRPFKAANSAG